MSRPVVVSWWFCGRVVLPVFFLLLLYLFKTVSYWTSPLLVIISTICHLIFGTVVTARLRDNMVFSAKSEAS